MSQSLDDLSRFWRKKERLKFAAAYWPQAPAMEENCLHWRECFLFNAYHSIGGMVYITLKINHSIGGMVNNSQDTPSEGM